MILRPASSSTTFSALRLLPTPSPCPLNASCVLTRARHRPFSHSSRRLDSNSSPTHYDILGVPPTATRAELKKRFYVLSKETHPDINRHNPDAGNRFAQISESYSVLADPEKRRRYDRDVMRHHHHHHGARSQQRSGGTYTGHRPASGLSKRRSAFKGPPPSFYAHGGPNASTTKQQAGQPHMAGTFNAGAYTDSGQTDAAFDARPVYKTQTHEDYRRASRRAAELAAAQAEVEDDNFWGRFIIVSGIIVLGVTVGTLVIGMANTPRGGLTRGDGSRRDGARNEWTKG